MATATSSSSGASTESVDDIRRQMAQIRQRLHQDMQGVVAGAEAASDWRYYVRLYPWAALGAAFAGGFLIVPRRRRSATRTAEKAAEAVVAKLTESAENDSVAAVSTPAPKSEKPSKGWIGAMLGLAGPMVMRGVQSYALGYVENWIAQQQAATGGPPPTPGPPGGTNPGVARKPGM